MRRLWLVCTLIAVITAAAASAAHAAPAWMDVATISSTLGNTQNKLCIGGGRADVGCPSYAPTADSLGGLTVPGDFRVQGNFYVSGTQTIQGVSFANGGVSATGTITATTFYGSGAGLTNLPGNAITITNGTSGSVIYRDNMGNLTASSVGLIVSSTGSAAIGTADFTPSEGRSFTIYNDGPNTSASTGNAALLVRSANRNAVIVLLNESAASTNAASINFRRDVTVQRGSITYSTSP
jgi:hypothetical protein